MLSTANSRSDPFWTVWADDDPSLAAAEGNGGSGSFVHRGISGTATPPAREKPSLRQNISASPVAARPAPLPGTLRARDTPIPPAPLFGRDRSLRSFRWTTFGELQSEARFQCRLIIAHDVGHSRDRSTAVVGGDSPFRATPTWDSRRRRAAARPVWECAGERAGRGRSPQLLQRADCCRPQL